jgi:hypothetical protein
MCTPDIARERPRSSARHQTAGLGRPENSSEHVYGWFVRVERGLYAVTDQGRTALIRWPQTVPKMPPEDAIGSEPEIRKSAARFFKRISDKAA